MVLPMDFDKQMQPGSFEFFLCYLIDEEIALAPFCTRCKHDYEGAPACDPAVLIKTVLLAHSPVAASSPAARLKRGVATKRTTGSNTL